MRKAAIPLGVLGLVLMVAAGLMAWWITPSYIARTPSGYNKTRTYDGTFHSVLSPAALASGNLAAAIRTRVPGTITDNVKVQQTSGNTALVQDTRTVTASGSKIGSTVTHYAVNRQTLAATKSHPGNWTVTPASGLTVSWPFGAKKQTYTGWVYQTNTTTKLTYAGQATQGGTNTYEYHAVVPPTRITNTQLLASLPKSFPAALVPRLAAAGLITKAEVTGLGKAFPGARTLPLGYTYRGNNTYWVSPATGLVVNVSINEIETAGIALPGGKVVPLIPVLSDTFTASPASLSAAASDANNGSSTITTWGVAVPIAAAALGFLLIVAAVLMWLRGRSRGRPVQVTEGERHPSPSPAGTRS